MIERTPRQLAGLGFLVLAGLLAWGGTVDPAKASIRWIFVALLGGLGVLSLVWRREPGRLERVYLQMIMLGFAIASVAWLIPATGSDLLLVVGALLIVLPLGLWIRARWRGDGNDSNHPR
jgi:hypothetical protein